MNNNPSSFLAKIFPYLIIGLSVVISIIAFLIFSWLLIFGIIIGAVIYLSVLIKNKLFRAKSPPHTIAKENQRIGNTYDNDEFN